MSRFRPIYRPVRGPADCWDWLTLDDVNVVALASLHAARQHLADWRLRALEDDWVAPFYDAATGHTWSDRKSFAEDVFHQFELRLARLATDRGILGFDSQLSMLAAYEQPPRGAGAKRKEGGNAPLEAQR